MAKHNKTGQVGESVAEKWLIKKDFSIIERNYRRKWGEIDILAEKDNVLHFVEVKTVSRRSFGGKFEQEINNYRPEDNMHPWKLRRLQRAVQTYLLEKYRSREPKWQFDLVCVFLDQEKKVAKVRFIGNLVL